MLTYSFENTGSDSLYEHLYKCIKNDILTGQLPSDYKLPSKRAFAKNLGISTITIENAYAQLIAEGYIYSLPKKGYYVSDIAAAGQASSAYIAAPEKLSQTAPVYSTGTASDRCTDSTANAMEYTQQPNYLVDFSTNHASAANFPFYTWAKLMKEVMCDRSSELLAPSPAAGITELRSAIAEHLYAFRGMKVSPEQIIVGAGTEYLYGLLIQLFGREKTFAVEDPGYSKIRFIYESNNVSCLCLPLDNEGIHMHSLCECPADILHLSPSHHYPTGIVTPISRRYELLGWASKEESRYIIEDDYDSEFRLLGKPIPSLQSIDVMDKVIYMNTFTKSLTPTIRISYMVLPKPLMQEFNRKLGFYSCTVSNFEQYTLARFIHGGHFEKHINRMRIYYRNQRDLLISAIKKSPLNNVVTIQEKDAGLHFLMKVDTTMSDDKLLEKTKEAGLKITCLSQYYYNQEIALHHTLVINYSAMKADTIPKAVELLYNCLT